MKWDYGSAFFLVDFAPDELEIGVREHILNDLEIFVRRQFAGTIYQYSTIFTLNISQFSVNLF